MQIRPTIEGRGTPSIPEDRLALQVSPWSSGYIGLKAALQIQRVAMPVPPLGVPELGMAGGSVLLAQDPAWLQKENTEEEAVAPGVLITCLQTFPHCGVPHSAECQEGKQSKDVNLLGLLDPGARRE